MRQLGYKEHIGAGGGADGRGTVTEFVSDVSPFTGFVKRECGDAGGDPSVNHMIIIDSSQGRPIHSCDYANGGGCTDADSNLDDDVVSGVSPGSPMGAALLGAAVGDEVEYEAPTGAVKVPRLPS